MDLDAYTAAHRDEWDRLDALARSGRLSGREADELIDGYQRAAAQLSAVKTVAGSTRVGDRLSVTLSRARLRFTAGSGNLFSMLPSFFLRQLPAALYRLRWLTLAVFAATVVVATLYAVWALQDPRVLANLGSEDDLASYANEQFTQYYSEHANASFGGRVWTNNAWIAAQCVAFGITGLWVPNVIIQNAQSLGLSAAIMFAHDQGGTFFLYIAPHGQLELTSVFVAGAAGLRIFWAWVSPGPRTRLESLAQEGRSLVTVAVGLILSLLLSGVVEGFVTPWPLQEQIAPAVAWTIKIGIGTLALGVFLLYMLVVGRRAHREGETGDLEEFDAGARRLVAA